MTIRMEKSANIEKPVDKVADKDMGATGMPALDGAEEDLNDGDRFARERQLILLSALYKLYGEDWKEPANWAKVAEEIKSAKIPNFGENFPPEICESLYLSLTEVGYQIGIGQLAVLVPVPKKLTPGQKRLWILAKTSADLSETSECLDVAFRKAYKGEYETVKSLHLGNSDIKSQAVAEALEVSSESGSDKADKEEYEDPEAAKVACELEQAELNKEILGFGDVLAMNQYCINAAEHAIKAYPKLTTLLKQIEVQGIQNDTISITDSSDASTPSKLLDVTTPINTPKTIEKIPEKSSESGLLPIPPPKASSTPVKVVEKETPAVATAKPVAPTIINLSSGEDTPEKPKTTSSSATQQQINHTVKPVVAPVAKPNQALIEIDVSPDKSLIKANKEKTGTEESSANATKPSDDCDPMRQEGLKFIQARNEAKALGEAAEAVGTTKPSAVVELTSSPEADKVEGATQKVEAAMAAATLAAVATQPVVPTTTKEVVVDKPKGIIPKTKPSEGANNVDDLNKTGNSENSDIVEIFPEKDDKRQDDKEVSGKEKGQGPAQGQSAKKKETGSSGRSTRTSSRLTSPEPNDQQTEEQKSSSKKSQMSRQSSSQQSTESPPHTPALRSRRGATPTKGAAAAVVVDVAGVVDSLTVELRPRAITPSKPNSVPVTVAVATPAPVAAPLSTAASTEDTEEETFETPRSTPESTEMGGGSKSSDVESTNKPLKPVKVYSVKPPSPLSQVDPRLLDEFIDEDEDAELVEIDSNVNKAKGLKGSSVGGSPSKSLSLRGRTVSSENASDAGGVQANEESTPSKRVTRKGGLHEDPEEDGTSNNEEGESKRLTRSSLKLHDAANEESTEAPQTESEKAASESSFGGKEKKPRTSKQMLRVKKLQDEKTRFYGDDNEESPDGKRLTRAQRARTSTSSTPMAEKRSKPPSVGDSEGLSESEPTPTRATRSRASTTATTTPAPAEPPVAPHASSSSSSSTQISTVANIDDEEQRNLKKSILTLYEKIVASEAAAGIVKSLQDDQSLISKWNADLAQIKKYGEPGKAPVTIAGFQLALNLATIEYVIRSPNCTQVQEAAEAFSKMVFTSIEELKQKPGDIPPQQPKNDNSDVESLESHDEQRSETSSSKQIPAGSGGGGGGGSGGRRKRKRSASETSEEVLPQENKRRVTRTSTSSSSAFIASPITHRKTKHPISPDIVSANRRNAHQLQ